MTVTSENKRNQYTITEAQVVFPYTFRILAQTHLLVLHTTAAGVETILTITTNYTVSGVGGAGGGNVTTCGTSSPYPTGDTITIIRDVPLTQLVDYVENDMFPSQTHENAIDKLTMIIQEISEKWDRMLILAKSSSYSDLTLPNPVAEKFLQWKSDLSGLKNVSLQSEGDLSVSTFVEDLLDDENATVFLATLGLDTDLLTLALPAGTTISTFIKSLLDNADAATARITLGVPPISTVSKPSSTTRNNTVVLANDPHLYLPVEAGERYQLHLGIIYNAAAEPDFQWDVDAPGSWTMIFGETNITESGWIDQTDFPLTHLGTGNKGVVYHGVFYADTAGTFYMRWAQKVSEPEDTTLLIGSWLTLTKLN